jgi:diphthamide biosynthesis enzyme Dph1/Dph2-like protein
MEVVLIKAQYKELFSISESIKAKLKKIPNKVGLVSTVQFLDFLPYLKKELESLGKEVYVYGNGQVLGCNAISALNIEDKVETFVYLGSGKFHPLQMALELKNKKKIFVLNPLSKQFSELDWNDVEKFRKRKEVSKARFLSSDKSGILVSIKSGQCNLQGALKLKEKFESERKENSEKRAYLFLFDNLDMNQLENFPEIEAFANTACPGLILDNNFVNIRDL